MQQQCVYEGPSGGMPCDFNIIYTVLKSTFRSQPYMVALTLQCCVSGSVVICNVLYCG